MLYVYDMGYAQFELEIVIFGLTRRNWIVLHGQAKKLKSESFQGDFKLKSQKNAQIWQKSFFFEISTVFWPFLVGHFFIFVQNSLARASVTWNLHQDFGCKPAREIDLSETDHIAAINTARWSGTG